MRTDQSWAEIPKRRTKLVGQLAEWLAAIELAKSYPDHHLAIPAADDSGVDIYLVAPDHSQVRPVQVKAVRGKNDPYIFRHKIVPNMVLIGVWLTDEGPRFYVTDNITDTNPDLVAGADKTGEYFWLRPKPEES